MLEPLLAAEAVDPEFRRNLQLHPATPGEFLAGQLTPQELERAAPRSMVRRAPPASADAMRSIDAAATALTG